LGLKLAAQEARCQEFLPRRFFCQGKKMMALALALALALVLMSWLLLWPLLVACSLSSGLFLLCSGQRHILIAAPLSFCGLGWQLSARAFAHL
jgi:hypothetical protein